jgi:hypothetical protein
MLPQWEQEVSGCLHGAMGSRACVSANRQKTGHPMTSLNTQIQPMLHRERTEPVPTAAPMEVTSAIEASPQESCFGAGSGPAALRMRA